MSNLRFGDVAARLEGHVALVEMRRPPHNFFDHTLIGSIADAYAALDAEPECRAIVLAAEGRSFCAGADFSRREEEDEFASGGIRKLYEHAVRIFEAKTPVIAAVQGAAIGGGLGVAVSADFRVVTPETRFAANFTKLGIHPGFGLTVTLPKLIGQQKAALLFLTGRRIGGEQALEWGLADLLVPMEELRDAAFALAREIAEAAPLAVMSTRATLRQGLADAVRARTEQELAEQLWLSRTEDHAEGVRAVSERRPGRFLGR
ncbi:MAG: enoyl-CoA hydratase/isomerase family protein [Bryobacteraceae bacterium]|nr:enoyl-CoA hydratase/isomerase family protein [Bryobacteraceae bacterium]